MARSKGTCGKGEVVGNVDARACVRQRSSPPTRTRVRGTRLLARAESSSVDEPRAHGARGEETLRASTFARTTHDAARTGPLLTMPSLRPFAYRIPFHCPRVTCRGYAARGEETREETPRACEVSTSAVDESFDSSRLCRLRVRQGRRCAQAPHACGACARRRTSTSDAVRG